MALGAGFAGEAGVGSFLAAAADAEDPAIATDAPLLHQRFAALAEAQHEVERLFARWAELEGKTR